ncbi:MAG: 1-acyl-sn-glycerol-3-phosphate acyltransferase [Bacteroidota bacterium]
MVLFLLLGRIESMATQKKFIDIEGVIGEKNPKLLKLMPSFMLRYLKRILHQDEINSFIDRNGHLHSFEFAHAIIKEFGANVTVTGIENLPLQGGCIVASNHPLGGLDGIAVIDAIGEKRKDLKFVVNDVLLKLKNLDQIFIGVNKHGRNVSKMLEVIDGLYASEIVTMIFPAGLVSRKQDGGVIKDLEWKKSFITKAKKYKRDTIPVYIEGKNTNFFYNLSRFRTKMGIKANIEMLYLVDEMYNQKGHPINIIFGKPISYTLFDKSHTDLQWAQLMKEHIYKLKDDPDAVFRDTVTAK